MPRFSAPLLLCVCLAIPAWADEVHELARDGKLAALKALLKKTPRLLEAPDADGKTPLHRAARRGRFAVVHHLLAAGARRDAGDHRQARPLHEAMRFGQLKVVKVLLEAGAMLEALDRDGRSPLMRGAWSGGHGHLFLSGKAMRHLIVKGADVDRIDRSGATPLMLAARAGHFAAIGLLADADATIDMEDKQGRTALHHAASRGRTAIVARLLRAGAKVAPAGTSRPLFLAASSGHAAVCRLLIRAGADVKEVIGGQTPLMLAAKRGGVEAARVLMEHGADPLRTVGGKRAIDIAAATVRPVFAGFAEGRAPDPPRSPLVELPYVAAARADDAAVVRKILAAHPAFPDKAANVVLRDAALAGQLGLARRALAAGGKADQLLGEPNEWTLLTAAVDRCDAEMVRLLLKHGAKPSREHPKSKGLHPLAIALRRRGQNLGGVLRAGQTGRKPTKRHQNNAAAQLDIVDQLIAAGADVNAPEWNGRTPLMLSVPYGDRKGLARLVAAGAKLSQKELDRLLVEASYQPIPLTVAALLEHGAKAIDRALTAARLYPKRVPRPAVIAVLEAARPAGKPVPWALHHAAYRGRYKEVLRLITSGADIQQGFGGSWREANALMGNMGDTPHGMTPLFLACYGGHFDVAKLLIARGAKTGVRDRQGRTLLHATVQRKHRPRLIALLVKLGLDRNARGPEGSPAMHAFHWSQARSAQTLLELGADAKASSAAGQSLLDLVFERGKDDYQTEMLVLLERHGVDLSKGSPNGGAAMGFARQHRWDKVRALLVKDKRVASYADAKGWTLLHHAAQQGDAGAIAVLLDRGAKLEAVTRVLRETPLFAAIRHGHVKAVKVLVARGANVNVHARPHRIFSRTPLLVAIGQCHTRLEYGLPMLDVLLAKGAKVNEANSSGKTALAVACNGPSAEVVAKRLLAKGANPNLADRVGYLPIHAACRYSFGSLALVKALVDAGSKLDVKSPEGWTPLECARRRKPLDKALIRYLEGR